MSDKFYFESIDTERIDSILDGDGNHIGYVVRKEPFCMVDIDSTVNPQMELYAQAFVASDKSFKMNGQIHIQVRVLGSALNEEIYKADLQVLRAMQGGGKSEMMRTVILADRLNKAFDNLEKSEGESGLSFHEWLEKLTGEMEILGVTATPQRRYAVLDEVKVPPKPVPFWANDWRKSNKNRRR